MIYPSNLLRKSIPALIKQAETVFNKQIRDRDASKPCVSCGRFTTLQAGHFYSAGHCPPLRFNPLNVHGQCIQCNYHLHGNLSEYRIKIVDRIGEDGLARLDYIAARYKQTGYKWDKFTLIEVIVGNLEPL